MDKLIFPSKIHGTVTASASKSFFQRAIALAILNNNEVEISNLSDCDDAKAALDIAQRFGCHLSFKEHSVRVDPTRIGRPETLHCGEAGLGLRMFTPLAALFNNVIQLTAEGSLLKRPVGFMEDPLKQLGVNTSTNQGFPPIFVKGPLKGGKALLDGSLSSQFLTGLLIALPKASHDSELSVQSLTSIPYIDMTLQAITAFGGTIEHSNYETFHIKGNQQYQAVEYWVEGDWSGAAGLLIAGAIGGYAQVQGLDINSTQADKAVLKAIIDSGAQVKALGKSIEVTSTSSLNAFTFDATHCPDLFPVLTALAANCAGISKIKGVHRLKHKESNRALSLKNEFNKIGLNIEIEDDMMLIQGGKIHEGKVSSHHDHRIAMAMVLAGINAQGPLLIEGAECVNKSYPGFYNDMELLGVRINTY